MAKNTTKPAWVKNQQREVNSINSEERLAQNEEKKAEQVTIRMSTNYRDVAKAGELYTTDAVKAEELVNLGRAQYVK